MVGYVNVIEGIILVCLLRLLGGWGFFVGNLVYWLLVYVWCKCELLVYEVCGFWYWCEICWLLVKFVNSWLLGELGECGCYCEVLVNVFGDYFVGS